MIAIRAGRADAGPHSERIGSINRNCAELIFILYSYSASNMNIFESDSREALRRLFWCF
jgi:hypothetical protein